MCGLYGAYAEPDDAECYELAPDDEVGCVQCMREHRGHSEHATYRRGEAVLLSMTSSPYGDGQAHYMCNEHLKFHFGNAVARFDVDHD